MRFRRHLANRYRIVEIRQTIVTQAMTLAEVHALRSYDAVQLAAAMRVHTRRKSRGLTPLTLISSDLESA